MKTYIILFITLFISTQSHAWGKKYSDQFEEFKTTPPELLCDKSSIVRVKLEDHVFEIPYLSRFSITPRDGNDNLINRLDVGCHQAANETVDGLYLQYSDISKNTFGITENTHNVRAVIIGIGHYDHMRLATGKLEKPRYSCRFKSPNGPLYRCIIGYMYSENIRVLFEFHAQSDISDAELKSYYEHSRAYFKNLEVTAN